MIEEPNVSAAIDPCIDDPPLFVVKTLDGSLEFISLGVLGVGDLVEIHDDAVWSDEVMGGAEVECVEMREKERGAQSERVVESMHARDSNFNDASSTSIFAQ